MKAVWLLTRRELSAYVRTPSGYLIAAIALLLNALQFNAIAVGEGRRLSSEVLELFLFNGAFVIEAAAAIFSMRMLAEERSSGAQTLLFTSPIKEHEIVLGKYLAALIFLSVVIVLSGYLPALIFVNGKVSLGHIFAGYVGMVLLASAVLGIGMLASSFSPHPFIAVLLTAVIVSGLELSWFVAKITDPPLKTVIAWASPVWNHYQSFRKGLLQLSDVTYFVTLTYFTLLAAVRVLRGQRWR